MAKVAVLDHDGNKLDALIAELRKGGHQVDGPVINSTALLEMAVGTDYDIVVAHLEADEFEIFPRTLGVLPKEVHGTVPNLIYISHNVFKYDDENAEEIDNEMGLKLNSTIGFYFFADHFPKEGELLKAVQYITAKSRPPILEFL